MTRAALLDWDGTLLDSRGALLAAWHAATQDVLGRRFPATAAEEALVFSRPGAELFAALVDGDAARAALLGDAFRSAYEHSGTAVRPFAGVPALLATLRDRGIAIGVVTSKARGRFDADAGRAGLADLVDHAVCAQDTTAHKPDPMPVRACLRALAVEPVHAVLAGDTPVDVQAARAAAVTAIGVTWGAGSAAQLRAAGADALADDPAQLAALVLGGCDADPREARAVAS